MTRMAAVTRCGGVASQPHLPAVPAAVRHPELNRALGCKVQLHRAGEVASEGVSVVMIDYKSIDPDARGRTCARAARSRYRAKMGEDTRYRG